MGVSTDAILVFGVDFQHHGDASPAWIGNCYDRMRQYLEFDVENDLYGHPNERLARELGWDGVSYEEANRIIAGGPVVFVDHCSANDLMWIAAVPGTLRKASRGAPVGVDPQSMVVSQAKIDALNAWLDERAPGHPQPAWLLVSWLW